MASLSTFTHFHTIPSVRTHQQHLHCFSTSSLQKNGIRTRMFRSLRVTNNPKSTRLRFSAEDEAVEPAAVEEAAATAVDQTVSVPVSPSDKLLMHFQAEGTMNEAAIPNVTKALEEVGGLSDLRVQVFEGIASVELTKETTIQATGVASGLLEAIQGSGFKLQTLNLSFEEEEELVA
ncbi:hypothetical protein V2J09_001290 [Rumex salicifolius]